MVCRLLQVVAAGNLGTAEYLQYGCIGDTTNVSSRVCGAAEAGEVVLSAATQERLTGTPFLLEPLPPVRVKGKDEPLELYRVTWQDA